MLESIHGEFGAEILGRPTHSLRGAGRWQQERRICRETLPARRPYEPNGRDILTDFVQIRLGGLLQVGRRSYRYVTEIEEIRPREASHDNPRQEQREDLEPCISR